MVCDLSRSLPFAQIGLRAITGGFQSLAQPTFFPNWPLCHDWWSAISRATYPFARIGLRAITGGPAISRAIYPLPMMTIGSDLLPVMTIGSDLLPMMTSGPDLCP